MPISYYLPKIILHDYVYFGLDLGEIVPKFTLNFNSTKSIKVIDVLYCVWNNNINIRNIVVDIALAPIALMAFMTLKSETLIALKALKIFKAFKVKFYCYSIFNIIEVSGSDRGIIIYLIILMQGIESNPGPLKSNSKTNLSIRTYNSNGLVIRDKLRRL